MYICICIFLNLYIDYTLILHLTKCQCVYNHQIPKKMGLPLPTNSPGSSAVSAQHVSQPKRNHFFPEDKLEPHLSRALKLRGYVAIKKWKFLIYINMYISSNNPIYIISYMCIYIYVLESSRLLFWAHLPQKSGQTGDFEWSGMWIYSAYIMYAQPPIG